MEKNDFASIRKRVVVQTLSLQAALDRQVQQSTARRALGRDLITSWCSFGWLL